MSGGDETELSVYITEKHNVIKSRQRLWDLEVGDVKPTTTFKFTKGGLL